jgi:NADPH:quinone reductase
VPLQRYVATVTLKPVTDGNRTFWHWESASPRRRAWSASCARWWPPASTRPASRTCAATWRRRRPAPPGSRADAAGAADAGAACVQRYGGPEALQAEDGECPAPGPGEVRIRQRAIGVNYFDVYLRKGWIPACCRRRPGAGHGSRRHACSTWARASPASCPATAWPTWARCPAPTAACAACPPLGGAPAAGGGGRDRRRAAAQGPDGRHAAARPGPRAAGTRLLVHAAAGGVGLLCAPGRGAWAPP